MKSAVDRKGCERSVDELSVRNWRFIGTDGLRQSVPVTTLDAFSPYTITLFGTGLNGYAAVAHVSAKCYATPI